MQINWRENMMTNCGDLIMVTTMERNGVSGRRFKFCLPWMDKVGYMTLAMGKMMVLHSLEIGRRRRRYTSRFLFMLAPYLCLLKFETRDPKTGNLVRYNADDDTTTLGEMLRHEKFGGGMADQKNLDAQFAKAIMGDGKFQVWAL
jgi:hypothetical protein